MMKISDPIMFGHVVTAFFEPVFTKYASDFASVGINPNNGFNDVLEKVGVVVLTCLWVCWTEWVRCVLK
jgi:isocitrate dehydrogenase